MTLRITQQIFHVVRLIILARLLAPHDFGLLGIALLTMATLETFSHTGFHAALIQKKVITEAYLNSAWTVSTIRGIILFTILYCIAPLAAEFFNAPEAKHIIQVIGLSILFQAITNVGVIYFQKELEFKKLFLYQLSGTLADFIVAVYTALLLRNVWALVFGLLAGRIVRCIMSYCIHPYRPHISLDFEKVKELFRFGKWLLGSSILVFLITQGDDIFVGKLLGATMLGFYQIAYRISNIPATEITHVLSQVTFPAYSKLQYNIPKLREAYLKVLQVTAFLSFPMAGLLFVLAPDFTRIFLGEKWMPMVPAMQVLALWGLLRSLGATTGPIFLSIGKPKLLTQLQCLALLFLSILIYPFTIKWALVGTSLAVLFSTLVPNVVALFIVIKITECGMRSFAKMILLPLLNTTVLISFTILIKTYLSSSDTFTLLVSVTLGGLFYFCITQLFDKFFSYGIYPLIKESILSLKSV